MLNRVVITGLGALTPIGNNAADFWANLIAGKSGAGPITRFDSALFKTHFACELKDFQVEAHLDRADIKRADPFTQYAMVAADEAIKDSGFDIAAMDPFEVGVIWGSGQGGMETFENQVGKYHTGNGEPNFSPFFVPRLITNMSSAMISIRHGLMGVNYTTVSACATSNTAIMDAFNYIRLGKAKIIVSGGSEAPITTAAFGGFNAIRALSTNNENPPQACRPFDVERDGFVMGEGARALVLEDYEHARKRGAHIYAEVTGAAMTADAYHMTATHPEGVGAARAMQEALKEAGITIQHFSGTLLADDRLEALDLMLYVESETIKATESSQNALLRSPAYFDAGEYPVMIFHSGRSPQPDDGRHINLQLTLKGIAKPVMLQILNLAYQAHPTERRALLVADAVVNASDFEIGVREMHDPDNELLFSVQLILRRPNSQNKDTAELNDQ